MSSRLQQAKVITDPNFLLQVQGSLYSAAAQVLNEDPSTANHANRIAWSRAIFANCLPQAELVAPAFLQNAAIAGAAGNDPGASGTAFADNDIDFVVASIFNTYADLFAGSGPAVAT